MIVKHPHIFTCARLTATRPFYPHRVHGSTLQQGFMDDWEKQKKITGDQLTAIRPQQSAEVSRNIMQL
jgi:hypothetical protein